MGHNWQAQTTKNSILAGRAGMETQSAINGRCNKFTFADLPRRFAENDPRSFSSFNVKPFLIVMKYHHFDLV